jgi:O-antigen/teichoic acid export membrane protein
MVTIFAQTGTIMLKHFVSNAATGYYSAAVTCAGLTNFVFVAIIDSFRPSIFESKKISSEAFEDKLVSLYSIITYLSVAQSVVLSVFAPLVTTILYGEAYAPTASVLRILIWYTIFSYMGTIRNIWLLAEEKQKYLWVINLLGAVANIVMNLIFIPLWNIAGAALAALLTQIFTNVILGFIIRPIRRNNVLILRGFNPANLIKLIKKVR